MGAEALGLGARPARGTAVETETTDKNWIREQEATWELSPVRLRCDQSDRR